MGTACDTVESTHIVVVHGKDVIEMFEVGACHLPGAAADVISALRPVSAHTPVGQLADMPRADACGVNHTVGPRT